MAGKTCFVCIYSRVEYNTYILFVRSYFNGWYRMQFVF